MNNLYEDFFNDKTPLNKLKEHSDIMDEEEWAGIRADMFKLANRLSMKIFNKPFEKLTRDEKLEVESKLSFSR